jgi:hypothetical protein
MLTQFGTDMYLIAAYVPQEYLEYLVQGTKSCNPLKPDMFLNMLSWDPSVSCLRDLWRLFGFHFVAFGGGLKPGLGQERRR